MVREVIETEAEFDGELAFELTEGVVHLAQRQGRIEEAEAFIDLIEARHPAAVAEEAHWFGCWRTENALLLPSGDVLTPLVAWVPHVGKNVDFFEAMIDRLRFHNLADEAIAAVEKAWPVLRDDDNIIEPQHWLLTPTVHMIIDRLLEKQRGLTPDDPSLWTALAPFLDGVDEERVRDDFRLRSACSPRGWHTSDFQKPASAVKSLYALSLDFRDSLHRRWGFGLLRAELARQVLTSALLAQEPVEHAPRRSPTRKSHGAGSSGFLLPNPAKLDEHLAALLGFMNVKYYHVAALALALFPWLSFLVEQGLVEPSQAYAMAGELRKRLEPLPRVLDGYVYDPAMQRDLERMLHDSARRSADSPPEACLGAP